MRRRRSKSSQVRKARNILKNKQHSFRDVHPTSTAGRKADGRDLPPWQGEEGLESQYVRCVQCGFPNDITVTSDGSGYGNIVQIDSVPTVQGGCSFCGSSMWRGIHDSP